MQDLIYLILGLILFCLFSLPFLFNWLKGNEQRQRDEEYEKRRIATAEIEIEKFLSEGNRSWDDLFNFAKNNLHGRTDRNAGVVYLTWYRKELPVKIDRSKLS